MRCRRDLRQASTTVRGVTDLQLLQHIRVVVRPEDQTRQETVVPLDVELIKIRDRARSNEMRK